MTPIDGIIPGQKIDPALQASAQELRRNMTPQERILWDHLRANHLCGYHFRRQQIIDGYIVDFYCHRAALVVEVDGPIHLSQQEYDLERDKQLNSRGLTIIHIPNEDIDHNLEDVLDDLRKAVNH